MALHVEGGTIRGMPRCMSEDVWEADPLRQTSHGLVADEMGAPDGVLMCDASGFVKKGKDSVGVARQSCGPLGKGEQRPGGVCAAEASRHGSALVDQRLFMPAPWCTEDDKDSRDPCHVPTDVTWPTQPPWAGERGQAIRSKGRLPCTSLVADGLSGQRPDCLAAVESWGGVTSLGSMPAETRWGLQRPLTTENPSMSTGEGRAKRVVAPAPPAPVTVEAVAQRLASSCGDRRTVSAGTTGPLA
jgi:hypothetical protein